VGICSGSHEKKVNLGEVLLTVPSGRHSLMSTRPRRQKLPYGPHGRGIFAPEPKGTFLLGADIGSFDSVKARWRLFRLCSLTF
jgi:hypothetical protein